MELITELISNSFTTGGFVFGFMSLTDKISNGVVVVIVETFAPCGSYSNENSESGTIIDPADVCPPEEVAKKGAYYKDLMSYGIGAIAILGFLSLLIVML